MSTQQDSNETASLEGTFLVGMPVGIRIEEDGTVTASVYLEDIEEGLREDDATPAQQEAAGRAFVQRAIRVELG